jgi:UDP-glucose 4-epimerase
MAERIGLAGTALAAPPPNGSQSIQGKLMNILVTGGAGYIGSHIVRLLESITHRVIVTDYKMDGIDLANNYDELNSLFINNSIDVVIHTAAKKAVGESVEKPEYYYEQNVQGTNNLLKAMKNNNVKKIVLSSSAAVYGIQGSGPAKEDGPCSPINPYGQTKLINEWMLSNSSTAWGLQAISLRFFNVAGAGWEDLKDPGRANLIPIAKSNIDNGFATEVYGIDYDTPDGSCIRDYVHVLDVAEAHLAAINALKDGHQIFNVGTGQGYSVLEILDGLGADYTVAPRRAGDPGQLLADVNKIKNDLGWEAKYGLKDILSI